MKQDYSFERGGVNEIHKQGRRNSFKNKENLGVLQLDNISKMNVNVRKKE